LQPLGVPNLKWKSITIDFILGLPRILIEYDSIFVVADQLTKFARFIPTITIVIASSLAELLMKYIFGNHSLSLEIISDRNSKFISEFWSSLLKLCGKEFDILTK